MDAERDTHGHASYGRGQVSARPDCASAPPSPSSSSDKMHPDTDTTRRGPSDEGGPRQREAHASDRQRPPEAAAWSSPSRGRRGSPPATVTDRPATRLVPAALRAPTDTRTHGHARPRTRARFGTTPMLKAVRAVCSRLWVTAARTAPTLREGSFSAAWSPRLLRASPRPAASVSAVTEAPRSPSLASPTGTRAT